IVCCGEDMEKLVAKTADATTEKHVPLIEVNGKNVKVTVGSTLHPMTEEHYIMWIYLETEKGGQYHYFKPGDTPIANFELAEGDKVRGAFEYCNIHGLWANEL
ncbi:MAG: desulfoferrodoxin family protein, partial [Bacilli bacterium]